MNTSLARLADLKRVLLGMERDLGLQSLAEPERLILCAAALQDEDDIELSVAALQTHQLTEGLPRSTFFKALKTLISTGHLTKVGPSKRSGYALNTRL
ncbi:MAG: MarR family transcriptional regulator [Celeribacter marinus]